MQVFQKLNILFYRKNKKKDRAGMVPVYCRLTITEAGYDEFSTGIKIPFDAWDLETHSVSASHPLAGKLNKKLRQIETDLERHFDLTVAQNGALLVYARYAARDKRVIG